MGTELADPEVAEEVVEAAQSLPAVQAHEAMVTRGEVSVADVVAQRNKIMEVMAQVMKEGVHYGQVPGIKKPTLLKPGAEVLNVTFRLAPSYDSERIFAGHHLTVVAKCRLTHAPSGIILGEGEGLCTTMEKKYAYRKGGRACPSCGVEAIKKSKYSPRESDYPGASTSDPPGWYCHAAADVGGCGANFRHDDPAITTQETGRSDNPDLPDSWNTVLKMADKRALVAAVLNCTAASDIFTQDVEESSAAKDTERDTEQRFIQPRGWGEWTSRMAELGVPEHDSAEWLKQASDGLDVSSPDGKTELFKKAKAALAEISKHGDLTFATETRLLLQGIFAQAFGGLAVVGPEWKISQDEDFPSHEEWLAAKNDAAS